MERLVSLIVLLAHLGVASIPCVEASSTAAMEAATAQRMAIGGAAAHSMPAASVEKSEHAPSQHAVGHRPTGAHAQHGMASSDAAAEAASHGRGMHDAHASHNTQTIQTTQTAHAHDSAHEPDSAHQAHQARPRSKSVQHELRAPCLCGCNERSNTPGTTTPQPPSFAPFEPEPQRLLATIPSISEDAPGPWPVSPPDVVDHIPIFS